MPIKDGFRSPSGKVPVANARVNNLQNVSEGSKVLVGGMLLSNRCQPETSISIDIGLYLFVTSQHNPDVLAFIGSYPCKNFPNARVFRISTCRN